MAAAMDDAALQRLPIPIDAEAGLLRGNGFAILDTDGRGGDEIELRDVFEPTAVGHGAAEAEMDLHQEVRTHRHIEGLGHMRDLEPGRDAADAADIDLHDGAGTSLKIVLKLRERVHGFADRDRYIRRSCEAAMCADIVGMNGLLEPGDIERLVVAHATDRFVERETLVGIGHDLPVEADLVTDRRKALHIFGDKWTTDLDFGPSEAALSCLARFVDEFGLVHMEPAALSVVEVDATLGAAGEAMQRQTGLAGTQVPDRGVD